LFSKTLNKLWPLMDSKSQESALKRLGTMRAAANGDVIAQAEVAIEDAGTEDILWDYWK